MEYEPLDYSADEIRLLEFVESDGDTLAPVECVLAHYSLRDLSPADPGSPKDKLTALGTEASQVKSRYTWGDYVALSYVWGSSVPPCLRKITINSHTMEVTSNLEAALRHLRDGPEARSGLLFWIDALCINQQDIEERSREVKRMKMLYETAQSVVVWLGNEFGGFDLVLDLINEIEAELKKGKQPMQFINAWHRGLDSYEKAARPLYVFFHRPYWKRLWIIQELAMGDDNTVVVCGSRRMRWPSLSTITRAIAESFSNIQSHLSKELNDEEVQELSEMVWRIGQFHRIRRKSLAFEGINIQYIDNVVRLAQYSDVTDVKDRVYGILGLLGDDFAAAITPDYSLSLKDIYSSFVRAFITTFENLNIILIGLSGSKEGGWSSWIPDLSQAPAEDRAALSTHYRAGGENVTEISFSEDGRVLRCQGFRIPIGSRVVIKPGAVVPTLYVEEQYRKSGRLSKRKGTRALDDAHMSAFWSSSFRNPTSDHNLSEEEFKRLHNVHPPPEDVGNGALEWFISGSALRDLKNDNLDKQSVITRSMHAYEEMESAMRSLSRRNFIALTEKGHMVWCDSHLQNDDIICIVLGCSYPLILRPRGEFFELVCECTIDQVMAGEALELLGDEITELETFSIC